MIDKGLENFLSKIDEKYGDMIEENDVCDILQYNQTHFRNIKTKKPLMPFLKIGRKVLYFKHDVIEFIKSKRVARK